MIVDHKVSILTNLRKDNDDAEKENLNGRKLCITCLVILSICVVTGVATIGRTVHGNLSRTKEALTPSLRYVAQRPTPQPSTMMYGTTPAPSKTAGTTPALVAPRQADTRGVTKEGICLCGFPELFCSSPAILCHKGPRDCSNWCTDGLPTCLLAGEQFPEECFMAKDLPDMGGPPQDGGQRCYYEEPCDRPTIQTETMPSDLTSLSKLHMISNELTRTVPSSVRGDHIGRRKPHKEKSGNM